MGHGRVLPGAEQAPSLLLASEIRWPGATLRSPACGIVAGVLRRAGLVLRVGPVVVGRCRDDRASDTLASVDSSVWPTLPAPHRPWIALYAVGPDRGALPAAVRALEGWAAAVAPRRLLLAGPRASCAGVERAIEVVERAIELHGPPVYVRRQIVHNRHVISDLERRGAVFVDEVDEVPPGETVILSAHGVAPAVRAAARARGRAVIDATCPLVSKVHGEARRFAERGYTILLVGHADHEEVAGVRGEAPERIRVIANVDDAERVVVADVDRVAYLTQTTLALDETRAVVAALRRRFPNLIGPPSSDICYATQNRQDAVRAMASECDVMLVIGSPNSSNSQRLVEVSERAGCPAWLIEDESSIEPDWLLGVGTIGLAAGASAPESLVQRVALALEGVGAIDRQERSLATESTRFRLPREVR